MKAAMRRRLRRMSPRLPRKAPNRRFVGYGSHEKLPMIKYPVLENATDVTST